MKLRTQPQDFQVDERLTRAWTESTQAAWSREAGFALFRLTKQGLGTRDAIAHAARAMRVPVGAFSYAGLKDKHASTAQHVALAVHDAAVARRLPRDAEGTGWRLKLLGWGPSALDSSAIDLNEFALIVRDLRASEAREMDESAAALSDGPHTLLAVNYFGAQRFGSARHGKGFAAQSLIAGDFLGAIRLLVGTPHRKDSGRTRDFTRACADHWGDWKQLVSALPPMPERAPFERLATGASPAEAFTALPRFLQLMSIEAFQSLMWNDTARRMVRALNVRVRTAEDEFGPMDFPDARHIPEAWRQLSIPVFAPGTKLVEPWARAAQETLASFDITAESLRVPGLERPFFGEAFRPLMMRATDVQIGPPVPDELSTSGASRRTVRFALPRGAYATVLMRALAPATSI